MSENKLKRKWSNEINVQWTYAKDCWNSLLLGNPIPAIPLYTVWETLEGKYDPKVVEQKIIKPMKITFDGVVYY